MSEGVISLVFAFKVTIFIRPQTVFKVMIYLVFAFKITILIRFGHELYQQ